MKKFFNTLGFCLLCSTQVSAQTDDIDEVVVTGAFIHRASDKISTPLHVIDAESVTTDATGSLGAVIGDVLAEAAGGDESPGRRRDPGAGLRHPHALTGECKEWLSRAFCRANGIRVAAPLVLALACAGQPISRGVAPLPISISLAGRPLRGRAPRAER